MSLAEKEDVLYGNIVIGNNCNIGWNVVIMPGVRIGDNCIIGVGAIVTHDVPDNSIVVGVPAKVIGDVYDYANRKAALCEPTYFMSTLDKKNYLKKHRPDLFG